MGCGLRDGNSTTIFKRLVGRKAAASTQEQQRARKK